MIKWIKEFWSFMATMDVDGYDKDGQSLHDYNENWEDVIAGFSLCNNLSDKEEALLDKIIDYLDTEYKDEFK